MTLRIESLGFLRHYQFLFREISCTLHAGELLQTSGANGSGKSTLLRILAGLLEPHAGTVVWQDKSIFSEKEIWQRRVHYLGHQNGIKSCLTPMENLQLSSVLIKKNLNPYLASSVLKKMGLSRLLDVQARHLSAGQLRRLALARLLLNPARVWILDEPLAALDTEGQQLLTDLLNQHLTNGGMAIVATHQDLLITGKIKIIHLEAAGNV